MNWGAMTSISTCLEAVSSFFRLPPSIGVRTIFDKAGQGRFLRRWRDSGAVPDWALTTIFGSPGEFRSKDAKSLPDWKHVEQFVPFETNPVGKPPVFQNRRWRE
jgi:hypothetical protein